MTAPHTTMRALVGALQDVVTEVESMTTVHIDSARVSGGRLRLHIGEFLPDADPLPAMARAAEVLDLADGWERPVWDAGMRRWRYAYSGDWQGRRVVLAAYSPQVEVAPPAPANPLSVAS